MTTKTALIIGLLTALTVAPAAADEFLYPDGNGNMVVQDQDGAKQILVGRGPSSEETMAWVRKNADRYPEWAYYYRYLDEDGEYWGPYYGGLHLPRGQHVYDDGKGNMVFYDRSGSKRIAVGKGITESRKLASVAPQEELSAGVDNGDDEVILAPRIATPRTNGSVVYYCPPELTRSGKGNGRTALSRCDN